MENMHKQTCEHLSTEWPFHIVKANVDHCRSFNDLLGNLERFIFIPFFFVLQRQVLRRHDGRPIAFECGMYFNTANWTRTLLGPRFTMKQCGQPQCDECNRTPTKRGDKVQRRGDAGECHLLEH